MAGDGKFGWYWGRGKEPEGMWGPEDSREAVLQVARRECDGQDFTICEADKRVPSFEVFDADEILEQYEEHNQECWSEDGPDISIAGKAKCDLEATLAAALEAWARENDTIGTVWTFGTQRNVEYFPVGAPTADEVDAMAERHLGAP